MISDILDYSQINKAGYLHINNEKFNILKEIEDAMQILKPQAGLKENQILIKNLTSKNNLIVNSDMIRIKRVIMNLVGNAIKFTEKGVIEVFVERI